MLLPVSIGEEQPLTFMLSNETTIASARVLRTKISSGIGECAVKRLSPRPAIPLREEYFPGARADEDRVFHHRPDRTDHGLRHVRARRAGHRRDRRTDRGGRRLSRRKENCAARYQH